MSDFLDGIKTKIETGDLTGAEFDLHRLIVNRDFDKYWGAGTLPVIWGYISHIHLDPAVPTAAVDLISGKVLINPTFLLEKIHGLEDLLFIVLHERDHRILRRIFRINWHKLYKILDFKEEWCAKVRNVVEDAWINASVRAEMGITATLPELFYCWSQEDAANPGMPTPENPNASGFDPKLHKVGEPKSSEYALLTCLTDFTDQGIEDSHGELYAQAGPLLSKYGLNPRNRASRNYSYRNRYASMMAFPAWFDEFCDWLRIHKNDLAQPTPGCEGDPDCPVHGDGDGGKGDDQGEGEGEGEGQGSGEGEGEGEGEGQGSGEGEGQGSGEGEGKGEGKGKGKGKGSGEGKGSEAGDGGGKGNGEPNESEGDAGDKGQPTKGDHSHGGSKPCTCRGGEGLLGEPMTLAERLSRVPDIVMSQDDLEKILDAEKNKDGSDKRKGPKPDKPSEVYTGEPGEGAGWGGRARANEIVPHEIQDLSEIDRELLEMGGSALTEAFKTSTVQIKGAVKRYADELVQNIATMRVTEHKIIRPDFNMPHRPSRRDLMNMGLGHMPVMWDHPQYLEQQELVVYTDVSGSMHSWYSVALYLTNMLKQFGCELYQFSTIVCKPVPGRDDNIFWGTGGTDFDTVASHIIRKGFKAVIIITDNQDCLNEKYHEALRELPELYAIFLQSGQRPRGNRQSYGGSWGRQGWQTVTDKITAIYGSDIGKK